MDNPYSRKKKRHNSVAVKGSVYTTALALTRTIHGKDQKIVVMGDADFMSNAELFRNSPRACNFNFATALFGWLDNGQFPVDTSRPDSRDNNLKLSLGPHTSHVKPSTHLKGDLPYFISESIHLLLSTGKSMTCCTVVYCEDGAVWRESISR